MNERKITGSRDGNGVDMNWIYIVLDPDPDP